VTADRPDRAARQALCATSGVTLNGQPARITGAGLEYARVTEIRSGLSAEWPWHAVARVVARGGRFES
jgi:hypothetical protein